MFICTVGFPLKDHVVGLVDRINWAFPPLIVKIAIRVILQLYDSLGPKIQQMIPKVCGGEGRRLALWVFFPVVSSRAVFFVPLICAARRH